MPRAIRFAGLCPLALILIVCVICDAAPPALRPNIVLIVADDLGYGDLGCYGQTQIHTPHLDQLAREGVRFTNFYAGSTVCAPSRCALMTGRHTGHARIRGNAAVPLKNEDVTLAEVLKAAGYATAAVGKWGLGEAGTSGVPNRQGFDHWFGYLNQVHAHNYFPDFLWRNAASLALPNVVERGVATRRLAYSPELIAVEALNFIGEHREGPFFLYFAPTLPHANNEAGKRGMEIPSDEPYSQRDWPQAQRNHAAMITRLDADVGRLLQKVGEEGVADRTLVLFTSDNGPHAEGGADPKFFHSAGPFRGHKRALYEGGIRVPLIVRLPGGAPAGKTCDQIAAQWDLLPTLAKIAGVKPPQNIDGVSIAGVLAAPEKKIQHSPLYWEFYERGFSRAVRDGNWKAVEQAGSALELYDLSVDPGEKHNLAGRMPEVAERLKLHLDRLHTASPDWPAPID